MSKNPPKLNKIGPYIYTMTYKDIVYDEEGEEALGLCEYNKFEITLSNKFKGERLKSTLLHEVIHALDELAGLEFEENQVSGLANILYGWMKDNKETVAYLLDE